MSNFLNLFSSKQKIRCSSRIYFFALILIQLKIQSQEVIRDYPDNLRYYNGFGIYTVPRYNDYSEEGEGLRPRAKIGLFHYIGLTGSLNYNTNFTSNYGIKYFYNLLSSPEIACKHSKNNSCVNIDEYEDSRFFLSLEYNYSSFSQNNNEVISTGIGSVNLNTQNNLVLNSIGLYFVDCIINYKEPLSYKIGLLYNYYTKNEQLETITSNKDLSNLKLEGYKFDNNQLIKNTGYNNDISLALGLSKSFNIRYLNLDKLCEEYSYLRLELDLQYIYTISPKEHILSGSSIRASANVVFPLPLFKFY